MTARRETTTLPRSVELEMGKPPALPETKRSRLRAGRSACEREERGHRCRLESAFHIADDVPSTAPSSSNAFSMSRQTRNCSPSAREDDAALFAVGALEVDVDLVAFVDADRAVALANSVNADLPFTL